MRVKFTYLLSAVLFVLLALPLAPRAQTASPIKDNINSPEYVTAPDAKNITIESEDSVTLSFPTDTDLCRSHYGEKNKYMEACVRDRKLTGRKATAGIAITPAVAGDWKWDSDSELTFTPKEFWKAGQSYSFAIDFDALNVPKQVVMIGSLRQFTLAVAAKPLKLTVSKMEYMQDPDDPSRKLVSAHVEANYPLDAKSFDAKTHVDMEENEDGKLATSAAAIKREIEPEAGGAAAWVTVPLATLPDQERYLRLTVDAGVEPQHGGQPSPEAAHERTRVPSLSTYLTVSEAATSSTRLPDTTPEQVLTFQTNVKAEPERVMDHIALYLLPAQHPVTKLSAEAPPKDKIYKWKAASEITPEILRQSELVSLTPMPSPDKETTSFAYSYIAPSGRYLYFVADKGLTSFGGYSLGRPFEMILQAPEWPHDLDIMQEGSILTLSGSHKLSLHARGTDALKVEIAHIRPEALQQFISQTRGDIKNPSFEYHFGKEDIARIDSKDLPMSYTSPQVSQYTAFDFSPYLKDGQKGLFLVSIQGYKDKKAVGDAANRFVLVSDLGLLVKQNAYTGRDVFLMSFSSGLPVGEAAISVLGRNGLPIFKGKTGADGHAALPDFTNFTRDREPVAIVAQKGEDFAFIPYEHRDREVNLSRFDTGGAVGSDQGLKAFLFSDRGIYRPGDTAHLGALVHNPDWKLPSGLPLHLVVTDPRGRKIRDEVLKFSTPGMQEMTIATAETWPTGKYHADLYIAGPDNQRGSLLNSTSFRVEEFQPDLLRIKTVFTDKKGAPLATDGWVAANAVDAAVTLTNLYGTPASDRRITGTVTLNPFTLAFSKYADYSFFDSTPAKDHAIEFNLPDGKTDAKGFAALTLALDQKPAATYSMTLQTQGFEAGSGKGVTAYNTILVSPMDYALGSHTPDNLTYLRKGDVSKISLIAVDPHLARIAVPDLTLELVRKSYVSTLVKHDDGSYAYESVAREDVLNSKKLTVEAKGTDITLPTGDIGDFAYRVKSGKGTLVDEVTFSVTGEGERTTGENRETVLKVVPDKAQYETGEKVELSITAPYTGAGLITLESDHVLAYKWFRTTKSDTVQSIAIPADFAGKGYVSVAFVRDINSHEIYLSPMSYAVVSFTANMKQHTTVVALGLPATVKPGENVTVHYSGNQKGKVFIYAVDEGILQVAKYKTPDPLHYFLLDRALQVTTLQMLDLLMPEYALVRKLSAAGGDGGEDESATLGKHLNPFKRKTLAPAVFWSGLVDLDTTDRTVTFTPPGHFNGEMRVMAIAATDNSIGRAEKSLTVQGDIVMTPNTPIFLAPGDESHSSVTVANNIKGSGKDAKIALSSVTTDGVMISGLSSEVVVPEGQEKTFDFTLKARDNPGPASLTITAANGAIAQKAEATLSVRPPNAKETTLTAGYTDTGSAKIALTRKLYSAFAERDMTVAPLPTAYIFGLQKFLDEYPYGCSEQTVSKAFPQVSLAGQPEFAKQAGATQSKVADAVDTLRRRQTGDGGFSYWDDGGEADPFITAYGVEFLTRAREAGFPVPPDLVDGALRYLRDKTNRDVKDLDDARDKAYAIYVMTSNGIVTTNEILHVLKYFDDQKETDWKTDLTAVYIASSYQLMQQGDMAKQTLDEFAKGSVGKDADYEHWASMEYNPFIKYSRYITLLARHFPDRLKTLDPQIVFTIATYIQENRYSTLSSGYAVQALVDYQQAMGTALAATQPHLTVDGKDVALETEGPAQKAPLPADAQNLELAGPKAALFYTVAETGFDRAVPDKPVSQGMQIERTYETIDGKPLGASVPLGALVDAVIKVNAFDSRTIANVAIVDLLPGGFEVVLDQPENSSNMTTQFVDKREDRIIAFGSVTPDEQTFRYRLRATGKGTFVVPPPYAEAMYDLSTKARGKAATITVTDAP